MCVSLSIWDLLFPLKFFSFSPLFKSTREQTVPSIGSLPRCLDACNRQKPGLQCMAAMLVGVIQQLDRKEW